MSKRQRMLGLLMLVVAAFWGAPALAQADPKACAGEGGVSLDQRIAACNAIIAAGRETPATMAVAYNNRGGAYYYKGDTERATADYDQAIKLDPGYIHAYNNRCWSTALLGRTAQAVADCSHVLKLLSIANTFENRGFAYLKAGDFDRAIADYEIGLRLGPPNPADFLYGRGLAKLRKGDLTGDSDIAAAKAINPKIDEEFAKYGLR